MTAAAHIWLLDTRPEHTRALEQAGAVYSPKRGEWWLKGTGLPPELAKLGIGYRVPGRDGAIVTGAKVLYEYVRVMVDAQRERIAECEYLAGLVADLTAERDRVQVELLRVRAELAEARAGYTEPDTAPELELDGYGAALDADLDGVQSWPGGATIARAMRDYVIRVGRVDCMMIAEQLAADGAMVQGIADDLASQCLAAGYERIDTWAYGVPDHWDDFVGEYRSISELPSWACAEARERLRARLYRESGNPRLAPGRILRERAPRIKRPAAHSKLLAQVQADTMAYAGVN